MNIPKTKAVVFDRQNALDDGNVYINGEISKKVDKFKYISRIFITDNGENLKEASAGMGRGLYIFCCEECLSNETKLLSVRVCFCYMEATIGILVET